MPSVKDQLSQDHEEQAQLLSKLAESVAEGAPASTVQSRWLPFEQTLLDHLEAEELSLFGVFVQTHQREIDALRAEHRAIRYSVMGLGVRVALHTVEKAAIDELLALLREHSAHEERTLHDWLAHDEGISSQRAVLAMQSHRERAKQDSDRPISSASPAASGSLRQKRVC